MEPSTPPTNPESSPAEAATAAEVATAANQPAPPKGPQTVAEQIVAAMGGALPSVEAAIQLLGEGYEPSFIARHRKAQTKGLATADLVRVAHMHRYFLGLEQKRLDAKAALGAGGELSQSVQDQLATAANRFDIDDIVAEATSARANGQPSIGDRRDVRALVRHAVWHRGSVVVVASDLAKQQATAEMPHLYEQFFALNEKVALIPANRYLAVCRGEAEGALVVTIEPDAAYVRTALQKLLGQPELSADAQAALPELIAAASAAVRAELRERSEITSIDGLGEHVRKLLAAAPVGHKPVVAVVPKLSAASDCVALDETGRLVATYVVAPEHDAATLSGLVAFVAAQHAAVLAISNGPGGMELYVALRKHLREHGLASAPIVVVEDAGSTEYGTSEVARRELAHVDLSLRAAVWVGRRMQDPLVELVKVDPLVLAGPPDHPGRTAAGLADHLALVITEAVTDVGVDVNTASPEQLAYIVGIGPKHAADIVAHRNVVGSFRQRDELMQVAGMTPQAYEQAASFLRIVGGSEPLDQTRLHPSQYEAARAVVAQIGGSVSELLGNRERLRAVDPASLVTPERSRGLVAWLLGELASPWRDRRPPFVASKRRDDLIDMHDLKPGMLIDGLVASVAPFGVFVDLGIYQDGLVHISQLLKRFGSGTGKVAVVGQPLRVTVVEVDIPRKRISLLPAPQAPASKPRPPRAASAASAAPRIAQKQAAPSEQLLAALAKPVASPRPASSAGGPRQAQGGARPAQGGRRPAGSGNQDDRRRDAGAGDSARLSSRSQHRGQREAQAETAPGFGVSGFTNSPFAKLGEIKK